ncbi:MAG: DnaA/Hda family protein [Albidovulum sp.]
MPRQLTFDLPVLTALGRDDFFVSPANKLAVAALDTTRNWPDRKMMLIGPEGSGKSHLAQIWAATQRTLVMTAATLSDPVPARISAVVIEDCDRIAGDIRAETALFHLHNIVLADGGQILFTARIPPGQWGLTLPDLASRMQATATAALLPPDDALLGAVLVKLFADRQIAPPSALIPWLVTRMDRSFAAARQLVSTIDAKALEQGRPIGRALAAEVLDSLDQDAQ